MKFELPAPTSHGFNSQRLRLHYVDWGNPDAPTLILLHGGRDHARSWDWVARELRNDWHIIAPDLRGHGDSAWSPDGAYAEPYFIYDLTQLIHQLRQETVAIVAHSLGGTIATRYAGLYPERVRKLAAIEGLGYSPASLAERRKKPYDQHMREWIEERRLTSTRAHRRYSTIETALERMRAENPHLSERQARGLTRHGVNRNEDGSFSWKFDNYIRSFPPPDLPEEELFRLWGRIACPVLLIHGKNSWASNPEEDGRARHFRDARVISFENAGHWPHHDQFEAFTAALRAFL